MKHISELSQRKVLLSLLFGLMSLILSKLAIEYRVEGYELTVYWCIVFPLIIANAYGPFYAALSGMIGLGAMFPFLLWPSNGYANIVATFIYLLLYIHVGYFACKYENTKKLYYHPLLTYFSYALLFYIIISDLYPLAFYYNPPFWATSSNTFIPQNILMGIITKNPVIQYTFLLFSIELLHINFIRNILGIKTKSKYRYNGNVFVFSFATFILFSVIILVFNRIFLTNTFPKSVFSNIQPYEVNAISIMFFAELASAYILMTFAEKHWKLIEQLKSSNNQIATISNNIKTGMIYQVHIKEDQRTFTYVSDSVKEMYGITPEEARADSMLIYSKVHEDDLEALMAIETKANEEQSDFAFIGRIYNTDGSIRWSSINSIPTANPDGSITWDGIEFIITEQIEKQEYIEYLIYHDTLTGLYNRRYYEQILPEFDVAHNYPLGIIMADVNGLKLTNDAFGHETGNMLLISVTEALVKHTTDKDLIARIGGDEFIILMPNMTQSKIKKHIQEIEETISKTTIENIVLSVSFGWAVKKNERESIEKLFAYAEKVMYRHKLSESSSMRNKTIKLIMQTLFAKNAREEAHCNRVSMLCEEIGKAMNLTQGEINDLKMAGLLHDIGKIGINESILCKKSALTSDERKEIERHSEKGYHILRSINELAPLANYILYHHERMDGKGYPTRLKGAEIPMQSKIIAVADTYDAITSDRAYRKALSKDIAIAELQKNVDTQFDREVVKIFVEVVIPRLNGS